MTEFRIEVTDRFTATVGVVPGYAHGNGGPRSAWTVEQFTSCWQRACEQLHGVTGRPWPSGVVTGGRAVYPGIAGCPPDGELVFVVQGTRNPGYSPNGAKWRAAVVEIVDVLRRELEQVTAQVVFDEVEMTYIRDVVPA